MLDPRGNLVSPVGFDPSGNIVPLQVTADGYLRVSVNGLVEDIQDIVGSMVNDGSQTGIVVTYDDVNGVIDFVVSTQDRIQLMGGHGQTAVVPAGATRYLNPLITGISTLGYNANLPIAGTVSKLIVGTNSAQPGSGNMTFKVQRNNADTSIIATVPAGAAAANFTDYVHTQHFDVNDGIRIRIDNNATANSAQVATVLWLYTYD